MFKNMILEQKNLDIKLMRLKRIEFLKFINNVNENHLWINLMIKILL